MGLRSTLRIFRWLLWASARFGQNLRWLLWASARLRQNLRRLPWASARLRQNLGGVYTPLPDFDNIKRCVKTYTL